MYVGRHACRHKVLRIICKKLCQNRGLVHPYINSNNVRPQTACHASRISISGAITPNIGRMIQKLIDKRVIYSKLIYFLAIYTRRKSSLEFLINYVLIQSKTCHVENLSQRNTELQMNYFISYYSPRSLQGIYS